MAIGYSNNNFLGLNRGAITYSFIFLTFLVASCTNKPAGYTRYSISDSVKVAALLREGDSIYSIRNGMSNIGKSMLYFDSAHRLAERINDTALLASTLYFIGNVYNAWNKEPEITISYYNRSANLFSRLPAYVVRKYYLMYLIAHAYDNEKGKDSARSIEVVKETLSSLLKEPQVLRDSMDYLPDFAWVCTNCGNYELAEHILNRLCKRSSIRNNPSSNNYLDHYYLSRTRIDVYKYKNRRTPYIDSLKRALQYCNNRFDSAYYCQNLSTVYSYLGSYNNAYHYLQLDNSIQASLDNSSILSHLQEKLLTGELEAEKKKKQFAIQELRNKNLYLFVAILVLMILVLSVCVDLLLKKRREAEKEMVREAQFTQQLLQKEEDERKRIASELHDGINHDLLTLKNRLLLKQAVSAEDVEVISNDVRKVSRNLYPALFEKVGLVTSVEVLCNKMTDAGLFTTCDIQYEESLSSSAELQLYRIIQEAVTNTAKHANAEAAKIIIRISNNEWRVEVKDNGRGFEEGLLLQPASFGLQSMRHRAKVLGAELFIESNTSGTKITLQKK